MLSSQSSRAFGLTLFLCNREWFGSKWWGGKASAAELRMHDPLTLCSIDYASVYREKEKHIEIQPCQAGGQNGHESGMGSSIWSCIKLVKDIDPWCDFSYSSNTSLATKARRGESSRTSRCSVWLTTWERGGFWCGVETNEIQCPKSWSHCCRKFCNEYHRRQGIASPRLSISSLPYWDCQLDPALMVAFWHFCSLGNGLRLVFHCI